MTIKKRLARSNIAMLEIPVLVAAAPSGCWQRAGCSAQKIPAAGRDIAGGIGRGGAGGQRVPGRMAGLCRRAALNAQKQTLVSAIHI